MPRYQSDNQGSLTAPSTADQMATKRRATEGGRREGVGEGGAFSLNWNWLATGHETRCVYPTISLYVRELYATVYGKADRMRNFSVAWRLLHATINHQSQQPKLPCTLLLYIPHPPSTIPVARLDSRLQLQLQLLLLLAWNVIDKKLHHDVFSSMWRDDSQTQSHTHTDTHSHVYIPYILDCSQTSTCNKSFRFSANIMNDNSFKCKWNPNWTESEWERERGRKINRESERYPLFKCQHGHHERH